MDKELLTTLIQETFTKGPKHTTTSGEIWLGLYNNREFIKGLDNDPNLRNDRLVIVTDEEVQYFIDNMNSELRNNVGQSQIASIQTSLDIPTAQLRFELIKTWLQQQGRDLYCTGLKLDLWTATLDHVITFSSGGVNNTSNMVWTAFSINQLRLNFTLTDFINKRILTTTQEDQEEKFQQSLVKKNHRSSLKDEVEEDIRTLKVDSERVIKKYGTKHIGLITRHLGFPVTYPTFYTGRYRGCDPYGNVQTEKVPTSRGERINNVIVRGWGHWSETQQNKVRSLVRDHVDTLTKNDANKKELLQKLYAQIKSV